MAEHALPRRPLDRRGPRTWTRYAASPHRAAAIRLQSHPTNRISRINSDGSISYERICDKMGIVTYDDTPADFRIEKKFEPLLKKGVQFSAVGSPVLGAVLAIWPRKDAAVPTMVLGAAVK